MIGDPGVGRQIDLFELSLAAPANSAVISVPAKPVGEDGLSAPEGPPIGPPVLEQTAGNAARQADKDPQAFRTIGEVAKALSIAPHVLRYWEEQFPLLRPVKRSGARRYYRPEDIVLVERINRLVHGDGYTLRGARQLLEAEVRAARNAGKPAKALSSGGDGAMPIQPIGTDPAKIPPSAAGLSAAPSMAPAPHLIEQLCAIRETLAEGLRIS